MGAPLTVAAAFGIVPERCARQPRLGKVCDAQQQVMCGHAKHGARDKPAFSGERKGTVSSSQFLSSGMRFRQTAAPPQEFTMRCWRDALHGTAVRRAWST